MTFTDSFLTAHEAWGGQIPGGPDAYIEAWGRAAELLGLVDPPRSRSELDEQMLAFEPVLDGGPAAREMARFVLVPPLPVVARPAYAVLAAGALATLPRVQRERLGLPWVPGRSARLATQRAAGDATSRAGRHLAE